MARVGLLYRIAVGSAAAALLLLTGVTLHAQSQSSPLDGRIVFPTDSNPHPPPPDLGPIVRVPKPIATQGRAGDPTTRNALDAVPEAAGPPERIVHSKPPEQEGRVGAPGSLPTPEEVESGGYRGTAYLPGAPPKPHYVPRPVMQMGRIGNPANRPSGGVEPEHPSADPQYHDTSYHPRGPATQGRVAAMYTPQNVAPRREVPPPGPPPYVPRPLVQEGRVGAPGSLPTAAELLNRRSNNGVYVPRPDQQRGRAARMPSTPIVPPPPPTLSTRPYRETGRVGITSSAPPAATASAYAPRSAQQQGRAASFTAPAPLPPTAQAAHVAPPPGPGASANPRGRVGAPPPPQAQGPTIARNTNQGRVPPPAPIGPTAAVPPVATAAAPTRVSTPPTGRASFNTPAPAQPGTTPASAGASPTTSAPAGGAASTRAGLAPGKSSGALAPASQ
jgi:hypothetical protein